MKAMNKTSHRFASESTLSGTNGWVSYGENSMNTAILNTVTEAQLQDTVTGLMDIYKWTWVHHRPARRKNGDYVNAVSGSGAKGWPDLFAVRGSDAIAWELKTQRGKVSPEQTQWIGQLDLVPGVNARVIRPSDLDWCEMHLKYDPIQDTLTSNSTGFDWLPITRRFAGISRRYSRICSAVSRSTASMLDAE